MSVSHARVRRVALLAVVALQGAACAHAVTIAGVPCADTRDPVSFPRERLVALGSSLGGVAFLAPDGATVVARTTAQRPGSDGQPPPYGEGTVALATRTGAVVWSAPGEWPLFVSRELVGTARPGFNQTLREHTRLVLRALADGAERRVTAPVALERWSAPNFWHPGEHMSAARMDATSAALSWSAVAPGWPGGAPSSESRPETPRMTFCGSARVSLVDGAVQEGGPLDPRSLPPAPPEATTALPFRRDDRAWRIGEGDVALRVELDATVVDARRVGDVVLLVAYDGSWYRLIAVDAATGATRWTRPLADAPDPRMAA